MKKISFAIVCALCAAVSSAAPIVDQDDVTMTQDLGRKVTITYVLRGECGVVTVDIQTNTLADATGEWVSIGEENQLSMDGAVNRVVTDLGVPSVITWQPSEDWPGRRLKNIVRAEVKAWATNNPPDVAVIDLVGGGTKFYTTLAGAFLRAGSDEYKLNKMILKRCHAAGVPFVMGSPAGEQGRASSSNGYYYEDVRMGRISADYYLGIYELTEGQYQYIQGNTPENTEANRKPHVTFSWNDCRGNGAGAYDWPTKGHAVDPASIMGRLRGIAGEDVDLPTSAQWEFACRAGTGTALANGAQNVWSSDETHKQKAWSSGWHMGNAGDVVHEVGTIYTNQWGFCDMHGNASEYVLNYMSNEPWKYDFENGPDTSPMDHKYILQNTRAIRGGGFKQEVDKIRSGSVSDWTIPTAYSDRSAQIGCRVCMPALVR